MPVVEFCECEPKKRVAYQPFDNVDVKKCSECQRYILPQTDDRSIPVYPRDTDQHFR